MSSGSTGSENVITERPCPAVRDRLLNVALQLFAQKGFESTSVREIASAAEVTKPTIYYYFKNKEGLYLELLGHICGTIEKTVMLSLVPHGTARSRIVLFVQGIIDSIENNENRTLLYVLFLDSRRDILSRFHERIRNFIVAIINEIIMDGIKRNEFKAENIQYVSRSLLASILLFGYDQLFIQSAKYDKTEAESMLDKLLDQIAS
ncbi:MAG: TetR family transcriptional [Geobacteraceae bacterium]|nr:MAG: TetR family transcriptional [Geobacteraceae bacterium]